jgi:hypothetical protein
MEIPYNLDDEARGELLTYLVISQLIARARSGEWLTPGHLDESENLWLKANGGNCDTAEWHRLGDESSKVASGLLVIPKMTELASLTLMFADSWRLDYRSPIVRGVFDVCAIVRIDEFRKGGLIRHAKLHENGSAGSVERAEPPYGSHLEVKSLTHLPQWFLANA